MKDAGVKNYKSNKTFLCCVNVARVYHEIFAKADGTETLANGHIVMIKYT